VRGDIQIRICSELQIRGVNGQPIALPAVVVVASGVVVVAAGVVVVASGVVVVVAAK